MWNCLQREMKILFYRRRMVFIVLIAAASAYALLIGTLYQNQTVQQIPVMVCDLNQSALSRQLVQDIASADQYRFLGTVNSEEEGQKQLASQNAAVVVVIPRDFSENYYAGRPVSLAFLQNGTNTLVAGYALPPMQSVWAAWAGQHRAYGNMIHNTSWLSLAGVRLDLRYTANPVQSYLSFYVYGVMLIAAQIGIMMGYALSAVFLLAVENLAGLIALYFRTRLALVQCLVFYTLPAFLLSGYIWPVQAMPGVIHSISLLQPVHYALSDFRQLALSGTAGSYAFHMAVLVSMAFLSCVMTGAVIWYRQK